MNFCYYKKEIFFNIKNSFLMLEFINIKLAILEISSLY